MCFQCPVGPESAHTVAVNTGPVSSSSVPQTIVLEETLLVCAGKITKFAPQRTTATRNKSPVT